MAQIYDSNPAPNPDSNANPHQAGRSRNALVQLVFGVLALFLLGVGAYSIYVAVHEPDRQETLVLGQARMAAGSPAALRVLVRNRVSGKPLRDAVVSLSLRSKTDTFRLGTFRTDATGSLRDAWSVPDVPPGEYQLVLESKSSLGRDRVVKTVEIQRPARVFLSSDKPIYQPGQTLHLRSLILNGRTQKPFVGESVTFEVKDPKGNKVFKETRTSSEFGIASADFVLAAEVNLGRYEIRAAADAAATARTVEVKRYVLPKFRIRIDTDRAYYLPGQTVSGSIHAAYFFGQPVRGGTVKLAAATLQEKPVVITELHGQTDAAGNYAFQFPLPDFFAGMPQKNEQAFLDLREISNRNPLRFTYSLCAKYPLRVQSPPSAVYEYYQPANRAQSRPVTLEAVAN